MKYDEKLIVMHCEALHRHMIVQLESQVRASFVYFTQGRLGTALVEEMKHDIGWTWQDSVSMSSP